MKLIGKLADDVEKAESAAEAKEVIRQAGMELTDEELEAVSGGVARPRKSPELGGESVYCPFCERNQIHRFMGNLKSMGRWPQEGPASTWKYYFCDVHNAHFATRWRGYNDDYINSLSHGICDANGTLLYYGAANQRLLMPLKHGNY